MNITQIILETLSNNKNEFVSSENLCAKTQISRIAIWQHIKKLKNAGYLIEAKRGVGYKLIQKPPDLLNVYEIHKLKENKAVENVIFFENTTSTMDEAGKLLQNSRDLAHKTLIVALSQTEGRGRKNRHWLSFGQNIYASYIYLPKNLGPQDGLFVMFAGCIAVCMALNDIGVQAKIKWPNDCLVDGKKISGILVDVKSDMSFIEELVIGFGVNVNWQNIPEEINATSTYEITKTIIDRLNLLDKIMYYLFLLIKLIENNYKKNILKLWKLYETTLKKRVEIVSDNKKIQGVAKDIDEYGFLLVETQHGMQRIITCDNLRFL
ncbi:MAG: biotin--[acetyl-CoA-carboxylase] ligase [Desulfurella sp.]|jgi:BirA family biotin operon repressor/biotin-[acetyl-CoA-carboxylase] ligase|uniref:Bifunctional ligase/repressor BirA n=2 Tax=Desulfurella TaxID=33001 RepID=A0A1G6HLB6_9BACT|nr:MULTISPECIES: biotin--[acetyl-CoA-carboxylase] ligase [Desulfurella]PMP68412.1 MAG: biotin--[acetyl-CoA-carboxylase] ligase [Desulfurella multipotens]PMP93539.1 MAG: biotin--[acetyl-CoA-carboxylase] ligase [Desulfurella sp.]SDB95011.1 BirA family transcriptional regulator, biotin operon repressor / biotin-[acetyl-CoA-carboxylase] ligase [Desulfurella multipotens]HEX13291.1 biotin--[acetyl-CoA-carboxylase] ligase [Desulfurella acetivorans]